MRSAAEQNLPSLESTPVCTPNVLIVDFTGFEFHENFIRQLALFQPFNKTCWVGTFQKPFSNHSWNKKMLKTTEIQHKLFMDYDGMMDNILITCYLNPCTTWDSITF